MAIAATTERRQVEHLVAPLAVVVVALALFWPRGSGVGPDLAAARATWGESGSTSYVWEYSIGAGVDYPPVRVTVAGRSVVAAEFSEPAAAEDWPGVSPWQFAQTVDDLFTAIDTVDRVPKPHQ